MTSFFISFKNFIFLRFAIFVPKIIAQIYTAPKINAANEEARKVGRFSEFIVVC